MPDDPVSTAPDDLTGTFTREFGDRLDQATRNVAVGIRTLELQMVYDVAKATDPSARANARKAIKENRPASVLKDFDDAWKALNAGQSREDFVYSQVPRPDGRPVLVSPPPPALPIDPNNPDRLHDGGPDLCWCGMAHPPHIEWQMADAATCWCGEKHEGAGIGIR